MQQILLVLENEGRQMEMVGCACVVPDGTGQKLLVPLSWHWPPWHGAPGEQKDAVVLLDVCPWPLHLQSICLSSVELVGLECCWRRRNRVLRECFLCCEVLLLLWALPRGWYGKRCCLASLCFLFTSFMQEFCSAPLQRNCSFGQTVEV